MPADNQTYGEVFTAPQSTILDYSFTLSSTNPFPFVSQLYQWNGTNIVGPAIFTSATLQTTASFSTYTFTPNANLVVGYQYVVFVTNQPNGNSLGGSGQGVMEMSGAAPPAGSGWTFTGGAPGSEIWFAVGADNLNADFSADFASTPLPAALPLFAGGLGVLGLLGWRRQRRLKAA